MVVGVLVNALILLCMYWELLSIVKDEENALDEMRFSEANATSHRFLPATMSHVTSLSAQEWNSVSEAVNVHSSPNLNGSTDLVETPTDQVYLSESNMHGESSGIVESTRNSSASKEETGGDNYLQMREENFASRRSLGGRLARMNVSEDGISIRSIVRWADIVAKGRKKMLWKTCIYLVTIGMLIAFLMGLDMSWTALTAALTLVVIDFKDARLCLEKNWDTQHSLGRNGASCTNQSCKWDCSACIRYTHPLKHCFKCAYCSSAWRKSGSISYSNISRRREEGVAYLGMGEHSCWKHVTVGFCCKLDCVRASS